MLYNFGFVIEQALGHVTHGKNLQKHIAEDTTIHATWSMPSATVGGMVGRINNWTVKAGLQARQAIAAMHREQPLDALMFHTQVPAILSQDWLGRIPSVLSLDATPIQYDSFGAFYNHEPQNGRSEQFKFWLNRRCYQRAQHLITWSEWVKGSLIKDYGLHPSKITTIHPGVDLSLWQMPEHRADRELIHILFVGGDFKRKGGHLLLDAFRQLKSEGLPVALHLVTKDTISPEPNVTVYNDMQPNCAELRALYQQCDIFCLPTFGDMLALVLAEAGAVGLPTISTRIAGIPEIIQDQETGFLTKPGDTVALIECLRELVMNPARRRQMGANAAKFVASRHNVETNSLQVIALLKGIANHKRSMRLAEGQLVGSV